MATPTHTTHSKSETIPLQVDLLPNNRLHELLQQRCVPLDDEITHIRAIISGAPAELAEYDAEIGGLQTALHDVFTKRAALQEYYGRCQEVLLPLPRLPSETLVEIFRLYSQPGERQHVSSRRAEIERLANMPLLRLSRVCSRWHTLIMGTPAFWSTIQIDLARWNNPLEHDSTLIGLLESVLERGGNSALTLKIRGSMDSVWGAANSQNSLDPSVVMKILAQHSERWWKVSFTGDSPPWESLSTIRDKVPLLQSLEVHGRGSLSLPPTDAFQIAPRLTEFTCQGSVDSICKVSVSQLRTFTSLYNELQDVPIVLSTMPILSRETMFRFQLQLWYLGTAEAVHFTLPPVTSDIFAFHFQIKPSYYQVDMEHVVSIIMDSLTLPCVAELRFSSVRHPHTLFPWPHVSFLRMCIRSSFHTHLQVLDISYVFITEPEVFECLAQLPFLLELVVSDEQTIDSCSGEGGADILLITDTFLRRLTWVSDPSCVVPRLSAFTCGTRLEFNENVLLEFILSRLAPGRSAARPFSVVLRILPGYYRELNQTVLGKLNELQAQGKLDFLCKHIQYPD
ncbi:hypothetical protein C8J57DRAFT_1631187 [Mycena rebaudengoi]|nr:hypothetical protein C8J57DRAFT_1631187 [Mycena rebaudengoi]